MKRGIILIITTLLILSTVSANMKTQIIAHRTNTIEKINQAIKTMEKPFVEIDVIKQDNQFIASHDKNPKNITTIKQILAKFKNKTKFDFDLKEQNWEIEFTDLVLKNLKPNQFIISSKYTNSLKIIKNHNSKIQLGLIITKKGPITFTKNWLKSRIAPKSFIKSAAENNFYLIPDHRFVNKKLLKTAEKHNVKIIPWTINNKKQIKKFSQQKQIKAVVTNNP